MDYIGVLKEEIRCKSEWISVEERLPEVDSAFLVYVKRKMGSEYLALEIKFFIKGKWLHLDNMYEVTHWMPPPEPSKGE